MNEYSAAMALSNLEGYGTLLRHDQTLLKAYLKGMGDVFGIQIVTANNSSCHNSHYAVLRISRESRLMREELRLLLNAENIYARRYFWPGCHRCPPYSQRVGYTPLPVTELLADELLQLPTGLQLTASSAKAIGELIVFMCRNSKNIRESLPT